MSKTNAGVIYGTVSNKPVTHGFDYGTQEFREFVIENWEEFRLTQVGNSVLSQNKLTQSNGFFKFLFVMQGANRACYASFRNKMQSLARNFGVKKSDLENFLKTVDNTNAFSAEERIDEFVKIFSIASPFNFSHPLSSTSSSLNSGSLAEPRIVPPLEIISDTDTLVKGS